MQYPIFPNEIGCEIFRVKLGRSSPFHTHQTHEFFFTEDGICKQFVPGKDFLCKKYDFFLFPAGIPHHAIANEEGCTAIVLMLDGNWFSREVAREKVIEQTLASLVASGMEKENQILIESATQKQIYSHLHQIIQEMETLRPGTFCAICRELEGIFLALLRDPLMKDKIMHYQKYKKEEQLRIHRVIEFTKRHFMYPLRVEDAARIACLSRSHFQAVFRRETGYTFIEFLNRERIYRASQLLLQNHSKDIAEIALECGFRNLSHFYRLFKHYFQISPAKWKYQHHLYRNPLVS